MRTRQDTRECRHCRKPMTAAEKASFQRFRKWEAANPHLAYPAQFKRWQREIDDPNFNEDGIEGIQQDYERGNTPTFTLAIAQQMAEDDEDAAERAKAERAGAAAVPAHAEMEPVCAAGI